MDLATRSGARRITSLIHVAARPGAESRDPARIMNDMSAKRFAFVEEWDLDASARRETRRSGDAG